MILLSKIFLLGFLPLCVIIYWAVLKTPKAKLWGLLVFSFIFYSFAGWQYTFLLISLSLITFWFARKGWFWPGIILNLSGLAFFKYWDFGVTMLRRILNEVEWSLLIPYFNLALPLGISFYIFKHIGYLVDTKNDRYLPTKNFTAFLTYSAFFPQISAGPFSNFNDTGEQLIALPDQIDRKKIYTGLVYVTMGLMKKLILAEGISKILALDLFVPGQGSIIAFWSVALLQGIYIYMDFSGYTDIALGIAYLFGITLPENFDNPFLAENPSSFWKRWHISLSVWFRVYIFSPISRFLLRFHKGKFRAYAQYTANWITMILVGLWHGSSSNYLIWGFFHGTLLNFHAWAARKKFKWVGTWVEKVITLIGILFSWHLFFTSRKELALSIPEAIGSNGLGSIVALFNNIPLTLIPVLIISTLLTFSGFAEAKQISKNQTRWFAIVMGVLLVIMITMISDPINFNYVQF